MIFGTGIDMIEVARVQKSIESISGFKEKIFSSLEIQYCESKRRKYEHFAARFAAKEAFFKAIGTGWRNGLAFKEIEVTNDDLGKPEIKLYSKALEFFTENKLSSIHISITHLKDIASAIIIIEK